MTLKKFFLVIKGKYMTFSPLKWVSKAINQ